MWRLVSNGTMYPSMNTLDKVKCSSDVQLFLLLLTAADQKAKDEEEAMLQKANLFFQDQKYKLHHHPVHVAHSKYEQASYLDALPINEEARHDMPNGYLDTLSSAKRSTWGPYKHQLFESKARQVEKDQVEDRLQIMNNLLTWDDYKHLVGELQGRKSEVNGKLSVSSTAFGNTFVINHSCIQCFFVYTLS